MDVQPICSITLIRDTCALLKFLRVGVAEYNAQMYVLSHCNILYTTLHCDSHALCASSCIKYLLALKYVCMLFTVRWSALTPSVCSLVTSSMDVMSYVVTCIAVLSVLSVYIHTVHSHCLHLRTFIQYYTLYTFNVSIVTVLVFFPNVRTITVTEYILLCISISILNARANLRIHVCEL